MANANLALRIRKPNPELDFTNNLDLVEKNYIIFWFLDLVRKSCTEFLDLSILTQFFDLSTLSLLPSLSILVSSSISIGFFTKSSTPIILNIELSGVAI